MKNILIPACWIMLMLSACSKSDSLLKDVNVGFSPIIEYEQVNRILQTEGRLRVDSIFPAKSPPVKEMGFSFIPPKPYIIREGSLDTVEIGNESQAFIPLQFSSDVGFISYFQISRVFLKVQNAKSFWICPISLYPGKVAGSIGLIVPALVREGAFKITLCAELSCLIPGYQHVRVVSDTVNALLTIRPPLKCGNGTLSGRYGLTIRKFDFGSSAKAGKVKVRFSTGGVPDRLEIRHGGNYVVSSCESLPSASVYPSCYFGQPSAIQRCFIITNQEWREFEFDYDPDKGRYAEVFVYGWCQDKQTGWSFQMDCPR